MIDAPTKNPPPLDDPTFVHWLEQSGMLRPDGTLDHEETLKNLADFYWMIDNTSAAFDGATRGRISKPMTRAFEVERVVQEHEEQAVLEERRRWDVDAQRVVDAVENLKPIFEEGKLDWEVQGVPAAVADLQDAADRLQAALDGEDL